MISLAQKVNERTTHHTPEEFVRVLDDPARDEWQNPHEVVIALALKHDEEVADIGARIPGGGIQENP